PDLVGWKHHEGTHPGMRVVRAAAVGIAAGRGAERKQRWPVAAVAPDRQPRPHKKGNAVPQGVQPFDTGAVVHQTEGIAVGVELAARQSRPCRDTGAREPALEAPVAPAAVTVVDRIGVEIARIELPAQFVDHRELVFLHELPQYGVDGDATRLNPRDGLGAVVRPVQDSRYINRLVGAVAANLSAQQFAGPANVLFAIGEHGVTSVLRPVAGADIRLHLVLVDRLPARNAVSFAGIRQALA